MTTQSGKVTWNTKETNITATITPYGQGTYEVETGNKFLDHMISQIAQHGLIDIVLHAESLDGLAHHLAENSGIGLGRALREAIGEVRGIRRMGHCLAPLDKALARVVVDFSGRGNSNIETCLDGTQIETLSGDLVGHFLESFAREANMTLHVKILEDDGNPHHKAEAICKALGRAIRDAVEPDLRAPDQVPSTKGELSLETPKQSSLRS